MKAAGNLQLAAGWNIQCEIFTLSLLAVKRNLLINVPVAKT